MILTNLFQNNMAVFHTQQFKEFQKAKGATDKQIREFLISREINPDLESEEILRPGEVSFTERLRLGFGNPEARARGAKLERQAGLAGKFDIGDLADAIAGIPSLAGFVVGGIAGTAVGGPVGAIAGGGLGSAAGEALRQGVGKALGVSDEFDPREIATEGVIGTAAGLAGPILRPIGSKVIKPLFDKFALAPIKKLNRFVLEVGFGTKGRSGIIQRFRTPEKVSPFIKAVRETEPGGVKPKGARGIDDVVKEVKDAITQVKELSVKSFTDAENRLIIKELSPRLVKEEPRKIIRDFLNVRSLTPKNIEGVPLEPIETKTINRIIQEIETIKALDTKSILNLKRNIQRFRRGTKTTARADALIGKINRHYNDTISSVDPNFRKALSEYSTNATFLEKLGVNITGTTKLNVEQTAARLSQLAKDLDDPFTKEASEQLLRDLSKRTGIDFLEILSSLNSARRGGASEGLVAGLIREIARLMELGVSEVAGGLGKTRQFITRQEIPPIARTTAPFVGRIGARETLRNIRE